MASDSPEDQKRLENLVGHPVERYDAICERIQTGIKTFGAIETDFLALMWCIDAYRIQQVVPRGMGNSKTRNVARRLEAVYRGKGNWFSAIAALILGQMTTSELASRSNVWGFSQPHQIDIAWPARDTRPLVDPLICCEAKLTGAPPFPDNEGRGPMQDWSNRRKELKFQATDLKLYRQQQHTVIHNWDLWRKSAPPFVYSLWAARILVPEDVPKMIQEAQNLTNTYSDGVGIYAFQVNETQDGYEPAPLSKGVNERVTSLDNVLGTIAAQISQIMAANNNQVPTPITPDEPLASPDL